MAAKYRTFGAQLQLSDMAVTPAFAAVANLRTVTVPEGTVEQEDATTHDGDPTTAFNIAGFTDRGAMPFRVAFDPADVTHRALFTALNDGLTRDWKVLLPTATPYPILVSGPLSNFVPAELGVRGLLEYIGSITIETLTQAVPT